MRFQTLIRLKTTFTLATKKAPSIVLLVHVFFVRRPIVKAFATSTALEGEAAGVDGLVFPETRLGLKRFVTESTVQRGRRD